MAISCGEIAELCRTIEEGWGFPWTWTPRMVMKHWADFVVRDAGFIKIRRLDNVLHVDLLAVRPECRGKGWGRRLMEMAENIARISKLEGVVLETQEPAFFKHLGYEELGKIPGFYYGKDGIACFKSSKDF